MKLSGKPRVESTQMSLSVAVGEIDTRLFGRVRHRCLLNWRHHTSSSHNWVKASAGPISSMITISSS